MRADARIETLKSFARLKLSCGLECLVGVLANCAVEVFVSGVSRCGKTGQAQRLTKALQKVALNGNRDLAMDPS